MKFLIDVDTAIKREIASAVLPGEGGLELHNGRSGYDFRVQFVAAERVETVLVVAEGDETPEQVREEYARIAAHLIVWRRIQCTLPLVNATLPYALGGKTFGKYERTALKEAVTLAEELYRDLQHVSQGEKGAGQ